MLLLDYKLHYVPVVYNRVFSKYTKNVNISLNPDFLMRTGKSLIDCAATNTIKILRTGTFGLLKQCRPRSDERSNLIRVYATVKILKFGTPQTIAIIVLKIIKFDVTLH